MRRPRKEPSSITPSPTTNSKAVTYPRYPVAKAFEVYYTDELISKLGMKHLDIEKALEDIAVSTMEGLADHPEWIGDPQQWADNHKISPKTTRILVHHNNIVGYYFFLFLDKQYIDRFRNGSMTDSDITSDMIIRPGRDGEYFCYFMDIAVLKEHRLHGSSFLLDDFAKRILAYTEADIYVSEICTVAFTNDGKRLCVRYLMETDEKQEIDEPTYSLKLLPFPQTGYLSEKYKELKKRYDDHYSAHYG